MKLSRLKTNKKNIVTYCFVRLLTHYNDDSRSIVHLERRKVYFEQAVFVVQVFDSSCHCISLVVGPVVVLRVDGGLPHVPG